MQIESSLLVPSSFNYLLATLAFSDKLLHQLGVHALHASVHLFYGLSLNCIVSCDTNAVLVSFHQNGNDCTVHTVCTELKLYLLMLEWSDYICSDAAGSDSSSGAD